MHNATEPKKVTYVYCMYLPFNIEDPCRESFPGPLHGVENVLEGGDPDLLQNGINTVATNDCHPLVVLAYMYMDTLVLQHDLSA